MPRRLVFQVDADIPTPRSVKVFTDLLAAGWGYLREEPVGPMETVGIGLLWYSRVGEFGSLAALPRPWSLVRNGLVERGAVDPRAHVLMLRSEVVRVNRAEERARLLVTVER